MDGMNEHLGPRPLKQADINTLRENVSNENVPNLEFEFETLRSIAKSIKDLVPNQNVDGEHIATLKLRFDEIAEKLRDGLPEKDIKLQEIDMLEKEVEAIIDEEFGEGGLESPSWERDKPER